MTERTPQRLSAVKSLYEILPSGTEGGKEFSRIMNLLLFQESKNNGDNFTVFDDSAGDFLGLDSYCDTTEKIRKGYQYKFYPSPLSDNHRAEIIKSLKIAVEGRKQSKIAEWILITPNDLIESSTRKTKGDVTWLEGLRKEYFSFFRIEHLGKTKLMSLFLSNPIMCLYYYPELVQDGASRKENIHSLRQKYDNNLKTLYEGIEFVGMSVRDEEASRSISMENIYIPLAVVAETVTEESDNTLRINPIGLLKRGQKSVILGDPGSGKSTLLRFLALVGISNKLQSNFNATPDNRLSVIVTLRRYVDELRTSRNLSILDYIIDSVRADFSLSNVHKEFFEYYFETGQAILLFDGLDELPDSSFKKTVGNRIRTFANTYLDNAIIVTSRIVGYGDPFRFDKNSFGHFKVAKLRLPEIEQFVKDWYSFRIDSEQKRNTNIESLINTIKDEDHEAIRDLAENPLLLTIITLVHRVDAILPDERVVLYEKCTDTLLETWQNSKYGDMEVKNRGRTTRRNKRRIEVIAHWMQQLSVGTQKNERAVVTYESLRYFLTQYISANERTHNHSEDPEFIAEDFLSFVKKRAGLLIEAGDEKYSFLHLTFQEYLTAADIKTLGEEKGVTGVWDIIGDKCSNPRWSEVIRLLIAGLRNDKSKEILINNVISDQKTEPSFVRALLLGGLLLDGVEYAEEMHSTILRLLLKAAVDAERSDELRQLLLIIRKWNLKENNAEKSNVLSLIESFQAKEFDLNDTQKFSLILIITAIGWQKDLNIDVFRSFIKNDYQYLLYQSIFEIKNVEVVSDEIGKSIRMLLSAQKYLILDSPFGNFIAASSNVFTNSINKELTIQNIFDQFMFAICAGVEYGPFKHYCVNIGTIYLDNNSSIYKWCMSKIARVSGVESSEGDSLYEDRSSLLVNALEKYSGGEGLNKNQNKRSNIRPLRDRGRELERAREYALKESDSCNRYLGIDQILNEGIQKQVVKKHKLLDGNVISLSESALNDELRTARKMESHVWEVVASNPNLHDPLLLLLSDSFALEPSIFWREALRFAFLKRKFSGFDLFSKDATIAIQQTFYEGIFGEYELYAAACQLIFDSWLYLTNYYSTKEDSPFAELAFITKSIDIWPLNLAQCVRELSHGNSLVESRFIELISSNEQNVTVFNNYVTIRGGNRLDRDNNLL